MEKFELQKLRDLPIEGVAERLGLHVSRHKCLCPFHTDTHPSLSFSPGRNSYRCFVCGASGSNIDLVMHLLNLDFVAACRWLSGESVAVSTTALPSLPEPASAPTAFDASRYSRYFDHPYLNEAAQAFLYHERRLDPRVVRWCRLSSWRDHTGTDWLQIPYFDASGRLTGIQNRRLSSCSTAADGAGSQPRFRFPRGSICTVYNLPVLALLQPSQPLYITEGCSDCWAMLSSGHKAIAIPSATLLKPDIVTMLRNLAEQRGTTFEMYPDQDAPGERLFLQLQRALPQLVHHQLPPGCKDYSEYFVKKLKNEITPNRQSS
ncbi:MAG: hypothetical protein K6E86_01755 [Bacteroidales bacterium]|nr:hypothetical protein [Bacteroidales bacterium]